MVTYRGNIHALGGENPSGPSDAHEAYDPRRERWQTMPSLPTPRHGLGAAVSNGRLHAIGGDPQPGLSATGVNEVLLP